MTKLVKTVLATKDPQPDQAIALGLRGGRVHWLGTPDRRKLYEAVLALS